MKEFVVYTGLRIGLFVAAWAIVNGVWLLFTGDRLPVLLPLIIAFAISGVASYYLLHRQRDAFGARIEERAARMTRRVEEQRAREDRAHENRAHEDNGA